MDLSDFSFFFRFSEMVVLSKVFKPDNFESHDSLNLRFINIQFFFEFCWLWIFSWIKLLWYYCSIWDKLERFDWLKQYHGEVVNWLYFVQFFISFPSVDQCPHVCVQFLLLSSSGFLLIRKLWSSFLAQFLLAFPQIQKGCSFFIVQMVIILLLIDTIFVIIKEMFHGRMSVKLIPLLLLLLLLVNSVSGSRMKLIHISLIINIRSRISNLYGFQLLLLLL